MLMNELMEGVERSNDAFSVMLASPGMFGGKGDAIFVTPAKLSVTSAILPALVE